MDQGIDKSRTEQKVTKILGQCIVHRVVFEPDPRSRHMRTTPMIVPTRRVCDLREMPEGVNYIQFHDVVEVWIQINDGPRRLIYTTPVNKSRPYYVRYEQARPKSGALADAQSFARIPVHPKFKGKLWVYSAEIQPAEQAVLA